MSKICIKVGWCTPADSPLDSFVWLQQIYFEIPETAAVWYRIDAQTDMFFSCFQCVRVYPMIEDIPSLASLVVEPGTKVLCS